MIYIENLKINHKYLVSRNSTIQENFYVWKIIKISETAILIETEQQRIWKNKDIIKYGYDIHEDITEILTNKKQD